MSTTPPSAVRQRGPAAAKKGATKDSSRSKPNDALDMLAKVNAPGAGSQWNFKIALGIITVMAFATRFYGISHPNEVVFDEVHFGKVSALPLLA